MNIFMNLWERLFSLERIPMFLFASLVIQWGPLEITAKRPGVLENFSDEMEGL